MRRHLWSMDPTHQGYAVCLRCGCERDAGEGSRTTYHMPGRYHNGQKLWTAYRPECAPRDEGKGK